MKIFLISGFISRVFSRIVLAPLQRPYKDQYAVTLKSDTMAVSFDFRDLLVSGPIERAFSYAKEEGVQISPWLDLLVEFNEVYEQALQDLSCSPANAYDLHDKLLNDELKKSVLFHKFINENFPEELDDFIKVFPLDIVYDVFQLTSGWCESLSIKFSESRAFEILRAYDYLEISGEKKADLFFNENGEPVRLRLKIIDLFCINFVYLLGKHELLKKYRSFFNSVEEDDDEPIFSSELYSNSEKMNSSAGALIKNMHLFSRIMKAIADISIETENEELIERAKDAEDNKNTARINAIKSIEPLKDYICLLKVIKNDGRVGNLFLSCGDYIFVHKLLYGENATMISLTNKKKNYSNPRVDLIDEFKTCKLPMSNRRLEIMLPFSEYYGGNDRFVTSKIPRDFAQCISCYANFMPIYKDINEVYIYSLLDLYKESPKTGMTNKPMIRYLVNMVVKALKEFSGLRSLLIDGFYEFPDELIPELQESKLSQFGAVSFYKNIDYHVINRIFSKECPLRKSISQFIGRFSSLQLLSTYIPAKQIKTAVIYIEEEERYRDFTKNERAFFEQISNYFAEQNFKKNMVLSNQFEIETVYFQRLKFEVEESALSSARPELGLENYFIRGEGYDLASEITSKCRISQVKTFNYNDSTGFISRCISRVILGNRYIKKIEIIINNYDKLDMAAERSKIFRLDHSCLILNMNAQRLIDRATKSTLCKNTAHGIFLIYASYVHENYNNAVLKIRLRQRRSDKFDYERLMSSLLAYIKTECIRYYRSDNHGYLKNKSVEFDKDIYEVNNDLATQVIRL
ncbi:hypothetical protein ENBRE01_0063 [Enteropsectra breve]|nr:hypothetical protein ENBRE01_0063 [Enteropsectra breve]